MDLSVPNNQRYWERHALTIYTRVGNIRSHTREDAFLIRCCHGRPDVALCCGECILKEKDRAALMCEGSSTDGNTHFPDPPPQDGRW